MKTVQQALDQGHVRVDKDVVVVGGGPAGICAAVGAAKAGASVLLLEQWGCLGGAWTVGLMTRYAGFYQHGLQDQQAPVGIHGFSKNARPSVKVISGVAEELFDRVERAGGVTRGPYESGYWGGAPVLDLEIFKIVADEYCMESGVEILFHALVTDAIVEGDACCGVVAETKSGQLTILAGCVVDCSGDADVAAAAGAPYEKGRESDGRLQPCTTMVRIGNIDTDRLLQFQKEHGSAPENGDSVLVEVLEYHKKVPMKGEYTLPNTTVSGTPTLGKGEWQLNVTRIHDIDATNVYDLTKAEMEGRRQARVLVQYLKQNIPGFENCYLMETAPQIGIRETRRITGEYTLTKEDVVTARKFEDSIARAGAPMDIHNPVGDNSEIQSVPWNDYHDIPYGCLVPQRVDGLVVAGRCVSATHEGIGAIRVTVICAALGHAAGVAAALSAQKSTPPRSLAVSDIQATLRQQGALI